MIPLPAVFSALEAFAWIIIFFGQPFVVFGEEHYNLHDFFGTAYRLVQAAEVDWGSTVLMGVILVSGSVACFRKCKVFWASHRPVWLLGGAICCIVLAQIGDAFAESDGLKGQSQGPLGMIVEELLENTAAFPCLCSAVALRYEKPKG